MANDTGKFYPEPDKKPLPVGKPTTTQHQPPSTRSGTEKRIRKG